MEQDSSHQRPLIICPLRHEMRLLRGAVPDVKHFDWLCCGPGAKGIHRAAEQIGVTKRAVILVGLAGGLNTKRRAGSAAIVTEVIDAETGQRWTPSLPRASSLPAVAHCSATSAAASATTVEMKRELFDRTAADVVDLESVAFAKVATAGGWEWGLVRGVSDGADEALPMGIDDWVDEAGRIRFARVLGSVVCRPLVIPQVVRLRSTSQKAIFEAMTLIFRVIS